MKIKMKVAFSGTHNGNPWPRVGGVAEVDDSIGAKLCASGLAVPVADDPVETATAPTVDVEQRDEPSALTTEDGPVKRRGRPRKD